MANLIEIIKTAAMDAVKASKPVSVVYGTVISTAPLQIQIDPKLIIDDKFLVLTRNVTDHKIEVSLDLITDEASSHTHIVSGVKTLSVHNGLKEDDRVIMLRQEGGQRFIVIDRRAST